MKLPVTEIMDLTNAVCETAEAVDAVWEDGKVNYKDVQHLPKVMSTLSSYGGVEVGQLLPQFLDIDAEEAAQLAAHFKAKFNITNDTLEGTIEEGYALLVEGVQKVKDLWAYAQKVIAKVKPAAG